MVWSEISPRQIRSLREYMFLTYTLRFRARCNFFRPTLLTVTVALATEHVLFTDVFVANNNDDPWKLIYVSMYLSAAHSTILSSSSLLSIWLLHAVFCFSWLFKKKHEKITHSCKTCLIICIFLLLLKITFVFMVYYIFIELLIILKIELKYLGNVFYTFLKIIFKNNHDAIHAVV